MYVITNDWHMARSQAIFTKVFTLPDIHPQYMPSNSLIYQVFHFFHLLPMKSYRNVDMKFISVGAGISDPEVLKSRVL